MTDSETPADEATPEAAPADAYLDFWQRNIMAWSVDPSLYHEWAHRLVGERRATPGDED